MKKYGIAEFTSEKDPYNIRDGESVTVVADNAAAGKITVRVSDLRSSREELLASIRKESLVAWFEPADFGPGKFDPVLPGTPTATVDTLARALFETDEEVIAHVKERSDYVRQDGGRTWYDDAALRRAFDICWERNDRGFRERAEARARRMAEVLK